jgi:hypothetical protein
MVLVDRLAAARDDQIGDDRPHLDQPLIRARL